MPQLLASLFLSLYTEFLSKWALGVGLIAGIGTDLIIEFYESALTGAQQTFCTTPICGPFVAVIAVLVNLAVSAVMSLGKR